ncbi:MAG: antibiotic biosynthesis monooxygenase [Verrucomicrobia bacterium]|nr:antibiotic biosynthesis monooxygenase [Verrucomicrobiota bacterium]
MVAIVVTLEAHPDKVDAMLEALADNAAGSNKEPGCQKWEYSQHIDDPKKFAIYEIYDDEEAIKAHKSSEHFLTWVKRNEEENLMASKQAGIYRIL